MADYLLIGFALHWVGERMLGRKIMQEWYWELASICLWPITIITGVMCAIGDAIRNLKASE